MKLIKLFATVLALTIFCVFNISAQEKNKKEKVFFTVEEMPEFPGGDKELKNYIANTVKYPEDAVKSKIQGKVYVMFVVEKDGTVGDVKIARGVGPLLDKEALRVINSLPKWKPGKHKGKKVRVSYTVPISFALN